MIYVTVTISWEMYYSGILVSVILFWLISLFQQMGKYLNAPGRKQHAIKLYVGYMGEFNIWVSMDTPADSKIFTPTLGLSAYLNPC